MLALLLHLTALISQTQTYLPTYLLQSYLFSVCWYQCHGQYGSRFCSVCVCFVLFFSFALFLNGSNFMEGQDEFGKQEADENFSPYQK